MSENVKRVDNLDDDAANRDPLTGEPGSHPVGTGVGATGGGVAGTVVGGLVGGPIGAVVGAAIGSTLGGLAGKNVAESVNPTVEDTYWSDNYTSRPYADASYTYEDYAPAYRTGYQGFGTYAAKGMTYDEAEPEMRAEYERQYSSNRLGWDKAKLASRDAWDRLERAIPGDIDRDGK